jgi:hypothetical protein
MTKRNSELFTDVEGLLKQSVVAEASSKIWEQFENALARLDADTIELLTQHFGGATIKQLSQQKGLSEKEIEAWLKKSKRELLHQLRAGTQVRH